MMNRTTGISSLWRDGAPGAALAALLGVLLLATQAGDPLARLSYDLLFALRPDVPVEGVVIVQMDEDSHQLLAQPGSGPWDRALHARLIERLTAWGARAIVFDVLFLGEREPLADEQLVRAAKASGRVVVAAQMTPEILHGQFMGWRLTRPFAALAGVAASGVVEEAAEDGAIRQHYWNPQYTNTPGLAWAGARLVMKQPPAPAADRWVNYYGPPGWIPRVSYHRVFETNAASALAATFSNKVVFVGAGYTVGFTGGKGTDEFRTPYTRWTGRLSPGVEIVATTHLNLVRGDWLARLRPAAECAVILFAALALGMGLAAWRPVAALGVAAGAALAAAVAAYALAWWCHVWFPWLIVAAAQTPCALGWSLFANARRLQRDKRSLEQRLVLLAAAEAAGGAAPGTAQALADRVAGALRAEMEPAAASPGGATAPAVPDHQLLRRIGQGAYGDVWLARDILGSFHAVKILHRRRFRDARPLERELDGLKRFTPISRSHPNLVHILHVGRSADGEWIYYVMEAGDDETDGQAIAPRTYSPKSLARVLKQRRRLPLAECLPLGIELAAALDFLHQHHLVHRDIKPPNIIFVNGVPKLADIGLVTDIAAAGGPGVSLGTPGYLPPEGPGTPAADVYSLGKLIYEAAFGLDCTRFPDLPRTLVEHADEEGLFDLNRILLKACENDPARRHGSARELRADLLRLHETLGAVQLH